MLSSTPITVLRASLSRTVLLSEFLLLLYFSFAVDMLAVYTHSTLFHSMPFHDTRLWSKLQGLHIQSIRFTFFSCAFSCFLFLDNLESWVVVNVCCLVFCIKTANTTKLLLQFLATTPFEWLELDNNKNLSLHSLISSVFTSRHTSILFKVVDLTFFEKNSRRWWTQSQRQKSPMWVPTFLDLCFLSSLG